MKYIKFTFYFLIYIISSYFVLASFFFLSILILYHVFNLTFPAIETYYKFVLIFSPFIFLVLFLFFYWRKYLFKLKFWISYSLIPLLLLIFFNTLFPKIYYSFSKPEEKKFKERINISSLSDFYFSEEENANGLLEENDNIITKVDRSFERGRNWLNPEFIVKNKHKLKKELKLLIELSEKIATKKNLYKSNPAKYEERPWEMGIPFYIPLLTLSRANLTYALINFDENKLEETKKRINTVLKFAKLSLAGPGAISGIMGILCYNMTIQTLLKMLDMNPEKISNLSDVINEISYEIKTFPLVIPHKNYIYKEKILIAPGLNKELYQNYKMTLFALKEINYKPYFSIFYNLLGKDFRNMNPVQRFFKKIVLFSIPPIFYYSFFKYYKKFLPQKYEDKYKYIKWYRKHSGIKKEIRDFQKDYGIPFSDYSMMLDREIKTLTLSNILTSVLKIENFKIKNGYYPDEFEEMEEDLYTGEKLIYKKLGDNSYIVYSVGENLTDDGGEVESGLDFGFKK